MKGKLIVAIAVALLAMAAFVPMEESEAASGDVKFQTYMGDVSTTVIDMKAGDTKVIHVVAWNMTGTQRLWVQLQSVEYIGSGLEYRITSQETASLSAVPTEEDNSYQFVVEAHVNKFFPGGSGDLVFNFAIIKSPANPDALETETFKITMNVSADKVPGANYNKILGIFDNPLDMEEHSPLVAAGITFVIWILVALLLSILLLPRIIGGIRKKFKGEQKPKEDRKVIASLLGLLIIFGLSQCIYIGIDNLQLLRAAEAVSKMLYIIFIAMVIWYVYCTVLDIAIGKVGVDDDSLIPLGVALGKIMIVIVTLSYIMSVLGINWTYIMTSMGIMGIVLGFGAQSTLAQFFSGLAILSTRPFKPGDLVRMNDSLDVLKVLEVGFMITRFKNWSNAEIFTMPNDKVVSSTIVNVTKGTRAYRVFIDVGVEYGTDVDKAKELMLEAAKEHAHVISDGSVDRPQVRLEQFGDSSLNMKLATYIDDFEDSYVYSGQLREAIYKKFKENGIVIAFPQLDINIKDMPGDKGEE